MRLPSLILVSLALATASITTMIGIARHIDALDRMNEDTALARIAQRQAQAHKSCATDRCTLSILFPDSAGFASRAAMAPATSPDVRPLAGAALAQAEARR